MSHAPAATPYVNPSFSLSQRQKLEILLAILLALFLFALDQTVVGTALPIISTDLNGAALYTWAFTIYLLTATISGPIYGHGRPRRDDPGAGPRGLPVVR